MIDGHIHFHKQPYSLDLISKMIEVAMSKGIDELYLLDHTHKFKEFNFLYTTLKGRRTVEWFATHYDIQIPLEEYISFIKEVKKHDWPIKLHFGLEVCYFKEHQKELEEYLSNLDFKFDFLIGSIHYVDGEAVDLCKEIFLETDVDKFYEHYFEALDDIIDTHYYDFIAHLDSIKLFDIYPSYSLVPFYERLARKLKDNHQETENNSGLVRHGYPYPGMNKDLLELLKKYKVKFHRSSDAHVYTDIGRVFDELEENLSWD